MSKYLFIKAVTGAWTVRDLCRVLGVSRSGYYQWRAASPPLVAGWQLAAQQAFTRHAGRYGTRRLRAELRAEGHQVGRYALHSCSAAYLLNQQFRASQRDSLLTELFGADGLHFSFLRHSIGASDFNPTPAGQATGDYTYDNMPEGQTDPGLTNFSIARDLPDVVPMLQAALARNSQLKILDTPWSAPA